MLKLSAIKPKRPIRIKLPENWHSKILEFTSNIQFPYNFTLEAVEKNQALSHQDFLAEIKNWYDGFRFEDNSETVYNPVSLANFFEKGGKFNNYWFETGTPTSLLKLIRKYKFNLEEALKSPVSGKEITPPTLRKRLSFVRM